MLDEKQIQDAVESLLVYGQNDDASRFFKPIVVPKDHHLSIRFVRPDHDAIQIGPIVETHSDTDEVSGKEVRNFTMFATIQVELSVIPDDPSDVVARYITP